uniref:AlNc14C3G490 protein n=1 Tax=Albugo laibachii Nc14 TaxID=890382 RepID=F0W012_9STRA|nr:AlNc14C3G490 [Albugo laibachii Nc14]|eukprot:CCA14383.1 AlNc14C3G490 [Albugo laibachii Nc14]
MPTDSELLKVAALMVMRAKAIQNRLLTVQNSIRCESLEIEILEEETLNSENRLREIEIYIVEVQEDMDACHSGMTYQEYSSELRELQAERHGELDLLQQSFLMRKSHEEKKRELEVNEASLQTNLKELHMQCCNLWDWVSQTSQHAITPPLKCL